MKINYFSLLVLLVCFISVAQEKNIKFGKVSMEEVASPEHHLDKEAEAAILYKKEHLFYNYSSDNGFRTIRSAHYRIKIYKKSGLDWGTIEVPLYTSSSGEESISQIKGYTYNLDNGKVEEIRLKKSSVFSENVSKYRNKVSISMPNVKEGSVIDLEYQISSDLSGYMDDFQLQYGIPVNYVDVSVEIPQYFIFKRYSKGFYPLNIKQSRKNRKLSISYREENDPGKLNGGRRLSNLEFFENVYKVSANNIPALKKVDYTDNIDNYRSAIKFELASTQFPNSVYKNYSQTWEDVAETIYRYDNFGNELKKNRFFKDGLETLTSTTKDKTELPNAIFNYVRDRMSWDEYYGVGCSKGIKKAYDEKTGNVADINLMLVSMLRYAGFKANPVLVSTKSHGIPLFPTRNGFNYVVAAIENNDGSADLMDATDKMGTINILPKRVLNWNGRLVRADGSSKEIRMTPKKLAKKITFINVDMGVDGSISGKMRNQNTGHLALAYRHAHKDETLEDVMEKMEGRYVEMEVDDLQISNKDTYNKPIVESCSFIKDNQTEIIADKIYFKPALFLSITENPFKLDEREYPVDFVYPQYHKIVVNYKIPEGYKIESIPSATAFAMPDGFGSFKYSLKQSGSQIQFNVITDINKSLIPPNYYASLKEFYNQMVMKYDEKIVLSKI